MTDDILNILVVDDDDGDRKQINRLLKQAGMPSICIEAASVDVALEECEKCAFSAAIVDYRLAGKDGLAGVVALHRRLPDMAIIMVTGQGDERVAAAAMRNGAMDYLPKTHLNAQSIRRSIENAVEKIALIGTVARQKQELERMRFEQAMHEKSIELERAIRTKEMFLASMSHELRTPLNAVLGFTGTLLMRLAGPLTAGQEKQLRMVQSNGQNLLAIIENLLDLSKLESGEMELQREAVHCREMLEEVAQQQRPSAAQKGLELSVDAAGGEIVLQSNRRVVHQILLNLTSNAIKFTQEGSVRLQMGERRSGAGAEVELSVVDSGVGIRREDRERLFQAAWQLDNPDTARHAGAGLGLHLSQKLAELLGGQIEFETELGKGSTFRLTLSLTA